MRKARRNTLAYDSAGMAPPSGTWQRSPCEKSLKRGNEPADRWYMATEGPDSEARSWQARPWAARAIRGVVLVGPIAMAASTAIVASSVLPVPGSLTLAIVRVLGIVVMSTGVIWATDRLARRLLPLAVLMRLSLLFPDQAPSRLKAALKGGSSRRLERLVDEARSNGLADDPGTAARQVIELIGALGDHDRRTRGHSERVRLYAELIGEELGLPEEDRQKLQWGALLHDLGKLMVPPEILNKPGKPDAEEWAVIQGHPAAGMKLIEPLRAFLGEWVDAIGGHHEKWDGSGYPRQLKGDQIPRPAAIVAVADSYEVMVAVRSYKKGMSPEAARAELARCAGSHFSPEVVRAFVSISIGRLRLIAGPLAALAGVPFIGPAVQIPSAVTALPAVMSSAAMPVAAAALAAVVGLTNPLPPDRSFQAPVALQTASAGETVPMDTGGSTMKMPTGEVPSPVKRDSPRVDEAEQLPTTGTTTIPKRDQAPGTTEPGIDRATGPSTIVATTTTTTTTLPLLNVVPILPILLPAERLSIQVADNALRLDPRPLDGADFPAGSKIYVFATTTGTGVDYVHPGGSSHADFDPYDMMGTDLLLVPRAYIVPKVKGTYTITATVKGNGPSGTVVATFKVS